MGLIVGVALQEVIALPILCLPALSCGKSFNPTALRKPKLYGVLAIPSAIGLKCTVHLPVFPPVFQRETTFMTACLLP